MYSGDLYGRVRRAYHVEGMSIREAARVFGLHRDTVSKMLRLSVPPGYRRSESVRRPKLDAFRWAGFCRSKRRFDGIGVQLDAGERQVGLFPAIDISQRAAQRIA